MSDSPTSSLAQIAGAPIVANPPVVSSYTASGAIAITDNRSLISGGGAALAMTLAAGTVDQHPITIKQVGTGLITVAATIDGASATITLNGANSPKDALSLIWDTALATYLVV